MYGLLQPVWNRLSRAHSLKHAACIPLALFIAGCSTVSLDQPRGSSLPAPSSSESAQQQTLRALTAQQDRLYRVVAPLLTKNAPLCRGNARNLIGFSAKNKYSYSADYVAAAQALGFGEQLKITGVLPDSGASRAGVQRGDLLTTVEGKPMPQGENAEREASALLGPLVSQRANVKLGLQRGDRKLDVTVPLTLACGFGIELGNTDNVNAYADGRRVLVTRGMLNFVRNDTELAYVLAKELAHNALRHPAQQRMTGTVGGIINNLIHITPDTSMLNGSGGVKAMPQELDAAADTLALYMLTRAGYDIDGDAAFWQRLANQYPASVPNGYTAIHPGTAYRLSVIKQTVADIKSKVGNKQTLTP
jgi:hypothetical protein